MLSVVKKILHQLIEILYPHLCEICGSVLSKQTCICVVCTEALHANNGRRDPCPVCGQNRNLRSCLCHIAPDQRAARIIPLFDYDDGVRHIAHALKYRGVKSLGQWLGDHFASKFPEGFVTGFDIVTAVPVHKKRLAARGYNQAAVLGEGFCRAWGRERCCEDILDKTRHAGSQTTLNREDRRRNLAGAFVVKKEFSEGIRGAKVLLFDDVVTTGATVDICAEALLLAGAAAVSVVCLASD